MPSSIDKIYDHLPEVKESSKFTHRKAFRGRALGKGSEFDQLRKLLSIYNECDVKVNENYQLGDAAKGVIYNYFTAGSHLSKRNLQRIALRYIACNTKPSTSRFVFYVMKMQQPLKHYFRQISRRYFYSDKENVWFASENFQFLSEFAARQFSYESMQVLLNRMKLWDKVVKDEDFLPIGKKSCRKAFKQLIVIAKESMMELNIELLTRNFFTKFSQMGHVLSSQTILAEQFYNSEDWISEKFSTMVDHFRSNIAHYTKADQLLAPEQAFADMKKKQLAELELGDPELVGPVDLDHHKEILCNLSIFYMSIALLLAINIK
ncbi:hypothetical protein DA717_06250 [Piscirickettsiaceae bacterium NZ-RLO2]|nr:hypothetical protein DA717_06250 [Piscirickettsiaceae bacterium NZ-RLO2]